MSFKSRLFTKIFCSLICFNAFANDALKQEKLDLKLPNYAIKSSMKYEKTYEFCNVLLKRGYITDCSNDDNYKLNLENAIKKAQSAYNLQVDGIADKQLYFAISLDKDSANELLSDYRKLIDKINSENSGKKIIVNIPSFSLKAMNAQNIDLNSRVVIGRSDRQTPIGKMNIISIKYNPDWTPPPTIMKKSVIPSLDNGTDWVKKHGLVAIDSSGEEVDIDSVSSSDIADGLVRLYQPAGASNALGRLKFETDSKENIYLHDTNERKLFDKSHRAHSSGCIRVKEWVKLASWFSNQNEENILRKVDMNKTFWEKQTPIPVYVIYSLADIETDRVSFYPDIYNKTKYRR